MGRPADAMVEAMPIDFFDVLLAGATSPPLEPYTAELGRSTCGRCGSGADTW